MEQTWEVPLLDSELGYWICNL